MPSPILARADALMHRRRQGETGPLDDLPVLTDIVDAPGDYPVLDADAPDNLPDASVGTVPADTPADATRSAIAQLADQLAERIAARLHAELPAMIDEAIADILAEHSLPQAPGES